MKHHLFHQKGPVFLHIYTVTHGDTLLSLADKFAVTVKSILIANALTSPDALALGQKILIPVRSLSLILRQGQTVSSLSRALQVSPQRILDENPAVSFCSGDRVTVTFPPCKASSGTEN